MDKLYFVKSLIKKLFLLFAITIPSDTWGMKRQDGNTSSHIKKNFYYEEYELIKSQIIRQTQIFLEEQFTHKGMKASQNVGNTINQLLEKKRFDIIEKLLHDSSIISCTKTYIINQTPIKNLLEMNKSNPFSEIILHLVYEQKMKHIPIEKLLEINEKSRFSKNILELILEEKCDEILLEYPDDNEEKKEVANDDEEYPRTFNYFPGRDESDDEHSMNPFQDNKEYDLSESPHEKQVRKEDDDPVQELCVSFQNVLRITDEKEEEDKEEKTYSWLKETHECDSYSNQIKNYDDLLNSLDRSEEIDSNNLLDVLEDSENKKNDGKKDEEKDNKKLDDYDWGEKEEFTDCIIVDSKIIEIDKK